MVCQDLPGSPRVKMDVRWMNDCLACFFLLMLCSVAGQLHQADPRIDSQCLEAYYTLPKCIDHPDGYGCECGPGFHWNTKMCMSSAIDSRFEFKVDDPPRYTLLLGRAFPKLSEFTVAFWINVSNPSHPGTVLSYRHADTPNVMRFLSGPRLTFDIWGQRQVTQTVLIPHELVHIAWSWSSKDGTWQLFKNGVRSDFGKLNVKQGIPAGGEFVLGQSSKTGVSFDVTYALEGDLSHLNIWNFTLPAKEVSILATSCTFQYCGNAVQWVEFRSGTRGGIRMRWPSGIFNPDTFLCFTERDAGVTCDKSCSSRIGAQCNEEIKENILWQRQPAQKNATMPCPGRESAGSDNVTTVEALATRSCLLQGTDDGVWEEPHIDDCISGDLLELKIKFQMLAEGWLDQAHVLRLAERLLNHTEEHTYTNPIDIATVIHLLSVLVNTQSERPQTVSWSENGQRFARAQEVYPTFNQTLTFCEMLSRIVNNLLRPRNELGWNATSPSGSEGDNLMRVMHNFADVIGRSLIYHIIDGRVLLANAHIYQYHEYIEFKISTQWVEKVSDVEFPSNGDVSDRWLDRRTGFLRVKKEELATNLTKNTVFYGVSVFKYKNLARILPSHDVHSRTKEDWVNSPVMAFYMHQAGLSVNCSPSPYSDEGINIHLPTLDTFNISNPECVRLVHAQKKRQWRWSTQHCTLRQFDVHSATCCCDEPGVFAVTTDMYNDNWDKGDKRPQLMNFASYFGCAASATMCLLTCVIHVYLRTSSTTAALHKNFSVSASLCQLAFMFGIDRYDNQVVCQVFAVLLHYFFLATYCWLMNEAFNLYIVITYSAHSNNDLTDTGSMIRYYVLGWVIPGVLVGAFVGTADRYYADDMCWVSPYHIWLFLGPAIGIICITILVQIFTAKEHNENSYTKSEKTNKIITIHMKGLWIQLILVTVCWSFAFMSIHIYDRIIKLLYALFNSLQGAFFVVFYLLLHEEVRMLLKSRQKKKALALQGFELTGDDHSIDSYASNMVDKDGKDSITMETRPKRRRVAGARKSRTRIEARIEASSDEASDHSDSEMISSV